ncbi:MAG TPA: FAD-binding oxidoreductase [Candidatus Acidoferrum sp.]|nr:FAD-binding oxidoreductase [Candidatus Acidoferrum sp.]
MLGTKSIQEELQAIVGAQNLRPAIAGDAICGVAPRWVVEPGNEQQVAAVLAAANSAGIGVIPRGGGSKLDWGNPPKRADLVLSMDRLNRIIEHAWADLTVTVEAGCTLQSLQDALRQHGQRLALDVLWPERATVGGAISTNDSGTLRLRFGALRDLIIGVTLALSDGTLASSGGKVVKNVAGYDLPKLATGALGTLGVITKAVFRLHPLCPTTSSLTFAPSNWEEMQKLLHSIQDSKLAHTAFQIRAASGSPPQADILFEATEAGLAAQTEHLRRLLGSASVTDSSSTQVWQARQTLFSSLNEHSVIAKFSVLPSDIAKAMQWIAGVFSSEPSSWHAVIQATGLGWLRFDVDASSLDKGLRAVREQFERASGSFVLAPRPAFLYTFDAWGNPGDALPLMRAVKSRLDPQNTLNPGRFVGGI